MISGFYNSKIHEDISIKHLDSHKKTSSGQFQCHGLFVKTGVTPTTASTMRATHDVNYFFSV